MRNQCLDKFSLIAQKADDDTWAEISALIASNNFEMKIKDLNTVLQTYLGMKLHNKEKEYVWESFKVKQYLEDNPDDLNERLVSLHALLNAKKQTRLKKIN